MDIGISIFPTERTINVVELAQQVESRGFESLWLTEHTHVPVNRAPGPAGGELSDHYKATLDPFVGLTAAAMMTTTLRLGFGILLLAQRDPIVTAKALASLDQVSNGRVMCGIGAGWIPEEIANHGTVPATRFKVVYERALAMRHIWTEDEAQFHGEFVDFGPIWSWPKPVQNPLPVFFGGNVASSMRRAVDGGDGWFPTGGQAVDRSTLLKQVAQFRVLCTAAGRGHLPVSVYGPDPSPASIDELRAGGVDRVVLTVSQQSRDAALVDLAAFAKLLRS